MSVIYGFGGMRIRDGLLSFEPHLPAKWKALSFKILYRGRTLSVHIEKERVSIDNPDGEGVDLFLAGSRVHLSKSGSVSAEI
jgi:trehalose/maltose hydrolase-like predicted phosphorylase